MTWYKQQWLGIPNSEYVYDHVSTNGSADRQTSREKRPRHDTGVEAPMIINVHAEVGRFNCLRNQVEVYMRMDVFVRESHVSRTRLPS